MELILEGLKGVLEVYANLLPDWLLSLLLIVGSLRILLKPTFALLYAITSLTPNPKDEEIVKKIESHKILKAIVFVLDWFASIKINKKK
jgi:hypothetical protein